VPEGNIAAAVWNTSMQPQTNFHQNRRDWRRLRYFSLAHYPVKRLFRRSPQM